MDPDIFLLAVLLAPPLLVAVLGKTKLWWLSGALLIGLALACLSGIGPSGGGAVTAMGNGIAVIGALVFTLYGLLMLLAGAKNYAIAERKRRQPEQPLPAAKLVTSRG